jgi:hypothetical protein
MKCDDRVMRHSCNTNWPLSLNTASISKSNGAGNVHLKIAVAKLITLVINISFIPLYIHHTTQLAGEPVTLYAHIWEGGQL